MLLIEFIQLVTWVVTNRDMLLLATIRYAFISVLCMLYMSICNSIIFLSGHSHANHAAELEKLRELLNSGLSLGELFSTGLGH